jgi:plastocyanin
MRRLIPFVALATLAAALLVGPATVARAGGGAHCAPQFTDAETDAVRLTNNCFVPTIARVDKGATVTFENLDGMPHTVTGAVYIFGDMDEFSTGERSFSFDEEGIFPYVCVLHPGMAGAIVVGDGEGKVSAGSVTGGSITDAGDETSSTGGSAGDAVAQAPDTQSTSSNQPSNLWLLGALILGIGTALWWTRRRLHPEV